MMSKSSTGRMPVKTASKSLATETPKTGKTPRASATSLASVSGKPGPTSTATAGKDKPLASTKISGMLGTKVVDPMGNERHKTPFAALYAKGGIPCRLQHGSVKHKLVWTVPPEQIDYNPLLVTFFEGLRETQHPYVFVVRQGIQHLLESPSARSKILAILPSLIQPLRSALAFKPIHHSTAPTSVGAMIGVSHLHPPPSPPHDTFTAALDVFVGLSQVVGEGMVPHLATLLPPIANKVLASDANVRETVQNALADCQAACGDGALRVIRARVPTFSPLLLA
ncbi:parkin co-regulated protein-domain-containing protein [Entophlyctis helioformis]|nr:parkin co-regulated protein-domain-containing protein [Entophlyctis helioformis]